MSLFLRHQILPAVAPAAVVGLYFTPTTLIGCAKRGLLALGVVLISTVAALRTLRRGRRAGKQGRPG